jgi:2-oxoglutarate ferredoxin oxidoreductase subunit alpha
MNKTVDIIQGAEACAKGAIKAGLSFFAGYPITPSTEIAEMLSVLLTKEKKVFMQMEDEIASIVSIVGASLAGAKAMTATSGPGFSLMQEGIGYACMTEAPIVICNVMRGGPSTGDPTKGSQGDVMQARWGTHGDHAMIVLCPDSVEEMYYQTINAFNLAEKYRNPVILLTDETITHMREKVTIDFDQPVTLVERKRPVITTDKPYLPYGTFDDEVSIIGNLGDGYGTSITGMTHKEDGFQSPIPKIGEPLIKRLSRKIEKHADELFEIEQINPTAKTLIITYGATSRTAKSIIHHGRDDIGLIRLKTLFPLSDETLIQATKNADRIIVAEMNLGQIYLETKRALACTSKPIELLSKVGGALITPNEMLQYIEGVK